MMKLFTIEEFRQTLFKMHSDKASGPNSFNLVYFKRSWHLCRPKIFHTCVLWLEHGEFPSRLVKTNVVLVLKKDNPKYIKNMKLISLCNVIYKIISKVLTNKVKVVSPKCIYQEQSVSV